MDKRSHFLFNYPKHQSTRPRTDFQILPLESKWQIFFPLLPFEIFQIILATGHEWWSWWSPETGGNGCILQKAGSYAWYQLPFRNPVNPLSPDREHFLPYHSWQDSPWVSGGTWEDPPASSSHSGLGFGAGLSWLSLPPGVFILETYSFAMAIYFVSWEGRWASIWESSQNEKKIMREPG